MKIAIGYIILVQEQRFRLVTDAGRGLLLTLAHDARASASDLYRWHQANTRVKVAYEGEPNLESGVTRLVRPVSAGG
jgi:hypothetical protein